MKRFFTFFLFTAALAARAALPEPDLIARIHFAGGDAIAADPNYAAFTNEFSSPEALALRQQIADKLAPWLAGWLQVKAGAGITAQNVRPLLDDLQTAEWYFEARTVAGKPVGMLAVKLNPARRQLWKTSLKSPPFEVGDAHGWLVCRFGDTARNLGDVPPPAPMKGWLAGDVNLPELARWYPRVQALDLPETKFFITAAGGQFLINGRFYFAQNLSARLEAWQIPTNEIHQSLTSFTAVRGFASWLAGQDWSRIWQVSPPVNQLFAWSLNAPFSTYAAAPVADGNRALAQLYSQLQPAVTMADAQFRFSSMFSLELTDNQIRLSGMPFIEPTIRPEHGAPGDFLFISGFPNPPGRRPFPSELLQTLAQPNLVYYHWELTGPHFQSHLQYSQLVLMLTRHRQVDGESIAYKWAEKATATLGNNVTEMVQVAPDQLDFKRSAGGGLTALEFFMLVEWLDAPDFPHCNIELPPLPERIKQMRLKQMQAQMLTAPAQPH